MVLVNLLEWFKGDLIFITFILSFLNLSLSGLHLGLISASKRILNILPLFVTVLTPVVFFNYGSGKDIAQYFVISWMFSLMSSFMSLRESSLERKKYYNLERIYLLSFAFGCLYTSPAGFLLSFFPSYLTGRTFLNIAKGRRPEANAHLGTICHLINPFPFRLQEISDLGLTIISLFSLIIFLIIWI